MSESLAPDVERVLRRMGREAFTYRTFPRALEDFAPPPDPLPPEQHQPEQRQPEQYSQEKYSPERHRPAPVEPAPEPVTRDHAPAPGMSAPPPAASAPAMAASAIASAPPLATLRAAVPPSTLTVTFGESLPARPCFADNGTPLAAVFGVLSGSLRPRVPHDIDVRDPPFPFRRR